MAAVDDLLDKIGQANEVMSKLAEVRQRLAGYREARQNFAQLVTDTQAERDALVAASETALRELGAAIEATFPPGP